jgi:hypothetical protein
MGIAQSTSTARCSKARPHERPAIARCLISQASVRPALRTLRRGSESPNGNCRPRKPTWRGKQEPDLSKRFEMSAVHLNHNSRCATQEL